MIGKNLPSPACVGSLRSVQVIGLQGILSGSAYYLLAGVIYRCQIQPIRNGSEFSGMKCFVATSCSSSGESCSTDLGEAGRGDTCCLIIVNCKTARAAGSFHGSFDSMPHGLFLLSGTRGAFTCRFSRVAVVFDLKTLIACCSVSARIVGATLLDRHTLEF